MSGTRESKIECSSLSCLSDHEVVAAHLAEIAVCKLCVVVCLLSAMPRNATSAKMDVANQAMCYALRNPPKGGKPTKHTDIIKLVRKKDGTRPTTGGAFISRCV